MNPGHLAHERNIIIFLIAPTIMGQGQPRSELSMDLSQDQLPAALSRSILLRLAPDSGCTSPAISFGHARDRGEVCARQGRVIHGPARCRPEPGPPPRPPTGSVFPRQEHVRATRSACARVPGGHDAATACRRRPCGVVLGPVVQNLCW